MLSLQSETDVLHGVCQFFGIPLVELTATVLDSFKQYFSYLDAHVLPKSLRGSYLAIFQYTKFIIHLFNLFPDDIDSIALELYRYNLHCLDADHDLSTLKRMVDIMIPFLDVSHPFLSSLLPPQLLYPSHTSLSKLTSLKPTPPPPPPAKELISQLLSRHFSSTDTPETLIPDLISTALQQLMTSSPENIQDYLFSLLGPDAFETMLEIMSHRDVLIAENSSKVTDRHIDVTSTKTSTNSAVAVYNSDVYAPKMLEKSLRAGLTVRKYKNFEELSIPAPKVLPSGIPLVNKSEINQITRRAFNNLTTFNLIQSTCFQACYKSPINMLVCAPTGAGKTNIALLAMLNEIEKHMDDNGKFLSYDWKMVYLAPQKALASEVVKKMTSSLSVLGIKVKEVTGDTQLSREEIESCQLIVATPEKWDVITRKSLDSLLSTQTRLIVIDEVHLLADDRGAVLEGLVARTLRQIELRQESTRILGLSATLPNYKDVADFLRVPANGLFYFDGSFRPVPLTQYFSGVNKPQRSRPPVKKR
ncbi:hypothetical protein GEMRC1_003053 [Eukaryota sp. GEM-RC1]